MTDEVRRLLLLRHAEAAAAPGLDDVERPLTERGESDAAGVGRWLHAAGFAPGSVLCSPALRARHTWDLAAAELDVAPRVSYEDRIYGADETGLLELLRGRDDDVRTLLLVGHNPAVHEFAVSLTGARDVRGAFPAASVAVVGASGRWRELAPGSATLMSFVPPASAA